MNPSEEKRQMKRYENMHVEDVNFILSVNSHSFNKSSQTIIEGRKEDILCYLSWFEQH